MRKNVCAYARVSTKEDLQLNSLDNQVGVYVEEIIANSNYNFIGIYADWGKSGTSTHARDEFNEMIEAARNGFIDLILVKSISRFSRNTVDSLSLVNELRNLGVEILFENDNISSFDLSIDMMLSIMSAFAEEEARQISENIKWSHRRRMREGKYTIATKQMLGFTRDENDNLIIDEDEAEIIRLIYKLYLDGYGIARIGRHLESEGYKTVTGNTNWTNGTIVNILENEKYKGDATLQKTFTPDFKSNRSKENTGELPMYKVFDTHPAIIDDETFDKVRELRRVKSIKYKGKKSKYRSRPEYTSFLTCYYCGKNFNYKTNKNASEYGEKHFACSSNLREKVCKADMVSLSVFEPALLKLINLVIKQKRNFSKDIEELMLKNEKYIYVKNNYEHLNAKVQELEEKLRELNKDSNSFNEALKGQLKAELKELLIERSKYYKLIATTYNIEAFIKRKRALLEKFNEPIEDVNEFPFRDLFSRVTVLSPSEVVFHLGFIDNHIEKEPYIESKVPYIFRRGKKTFTFYLVV